MRPLLALLLLALASCEQSRTELIVRVDSQLPWGPGQAVQSVVLEIRREGPSGPLRSLRTTVVGTAAGQRPLPFTVGVTPADDSDAPVWFRLLGCSSSVGCTPADAVARAEAAERFVPGQTLDIALALGTADAGVDGGNDAGELPDATEVGVDVIAPDLGAGADVDELPDVMSATDALVDVANPTDAGGSDLGPLDAGLVDGGVPDVAAADVGMDAGTPEAGPVDAGVPDTGTLDVGSFDAGTLDASGPEDTGPPDTGPHDTGPPPPCTGPLCACAPTAPAGWCSIGATCASGACMAGPAMGALVITEIMSDPDMVGDLQGEWFEVYNRSATPVDLRGMRVRGNGTEVFEVTASGPLLVAGRGYAVIAKNGDMVTNGGVTMLFAYGSAMDFSNSTSSPDSLTLLASDGSTVIDSVSYANTVASGWPVIAGRSKSLRPAILDATMNDTSSAWCPGGPAYGRGDFGTPGAANVCQ